jgi:hypothetical protein
MNKSILFAIEPESAITKGNKYHLESPDN